MRYLLFMKLKSKFGIIHKDDTPDLKMHLSYSKRAPEFDPSGKYKEDRMTSGQLLAWRLPEEFAEVFIQSEYRAQLSIRWLKHIECNKLIGWLHGHDISDVISVTIVGNVITENRLNKS